MTAGMVHVTDPVPPGSELQPYATSTDGRVCFAVGLCTLN
jgi:hypothetical protein